MDAGVNAIVRNIMTEVETAAAELGLDLPIPRPQEDFK
jgi:hypothetical protein